MKKEYSTDELTVSWEPDICSHSTICWKAATGLPSVFNPSKPPWIEITASGTDHIIEQVKKCPSGALKYIDKREHIASAVSVQNSETTVTVAPNGPLLINGAITVTDVNGSITQVTKAALCRCGASNKKPFCDGSHKTNGFKDDERKE